MSIQNRSVGAVVSIAGRTLFFLYISVKIYKTGIDDDVVAFFQFLFLQSVLVTFLSASGYFRALSPSDDDRAAMVATVHTLFSIFGCIFIPFCATLFLDGADRMLCMALGFGAGMTAISGMLTGRTLKMKGATRAFSPSIVSALICLVLLSLLESPDSRACLMLIVLYQSLTASILLVINNDLIYRSISMDFGSLLCGLVLHLKDNLLFGLVNTYAVFALYLFREFWSAGNDAKVVATAFFVMRISDLAMQLFMTVFASHKWLNKLVELATIKVVTFVFIVFSGLMLILLWLYSGIVSSNEISLFKLLVSQALIDIVRFPLAIVFLWQVAARDTVNYVWYVFIPISVVFTVSLISHWEDQVYGIYVFIAVTSMVGYLVFSLQNSYRMKAKVNLK